MQDEELLTVAEVAARLKVPPSTVRRWIREGKLRATMMGGTKTGYRVPSGEVRRLVASGLTGQEQKAS